MSGQRERVLDYPEFMGKDVFVSMAGGGECRGELRGVDKSNNIVLDDCIYRPPDNSKELVLGFVVLHGKHVHSLMSSDIMPISNPYADHEEEA